MDKEYYIEWRIEISAQSPEEAARKARQIQLNPQSIATVFHVYPSDDGEAIEIDLTALDGQDGDL